jgi:hypothetical protein
MRKLLLGLVLLNIILFSAHWMSSAPVVAEEWVDRSDTGQAIQLLGEENLAERKESDVNPMCVRVGPFRQLLHAEYFQENISVLGVQAEIKEMVNSESLAYRVDLVKKALAGAEAATSDISAMQAQGINVFMLADNDQLSLGVFEREDDARVAIKGLPESEYSATIVPHKIASGENWVVMSVQESNKLNKKQWLQLLNAFQGAEKQHFFCLSVASL